MGLFKFFQDTTERDRKIGMLALGLQEFQTSRQADKLDDLLADMVNEHGRDIAIVPVFAKMLDTIADVNPVVACNLARSLVWHKNSEELNTMLVGRFLKWADQVPKETVFEAFAKLNIQNGQKKPVLEQEFVKKWLELVNPLSPLEKSEAALKAKDYEGSQFLVDRKRLTLWDRMAATVWAEAARQLPKDVALKQAIDIQPDAYQKAIPRWQNTYLINAADRYIREHAPQMSPEHFAESLKPNVS